MGKCRKCGKSGLFLRLDADMLCKDCAAQKVREKYIDELNQKYAEISDKLSDSEKLYNSICEKAKADAILQVTNEIEEAQKKVSELNLDISEKTSSLNFLNADLEKKDTQISNQAQKLKKLRAAIMAAQAAIDSSASETAVSSEEIEQLVFTVEELLSPTVELKLNCLDIKQLRSEHKNNEKLIQDVLDKYQSRYTTKANMAIYRLMVIALKAELQNVIYNLKYERLDDAKAQILEITKKYSIIAAEGNQSIAPTVSKFIKEIEVLFVNAIEIEYEYYVKKERIKEEQRALREQMRQEAEERKILEQQKKQVEKEESKYKTEIAGLKESLKDEEDDEKNRKLRERIAQLEQQLNDVEAKKDQIISRQNGKAGYVYIISNLGSFGDSMFKVGMTRRLEPQERINELGDASVPFPFDVHSFIFSDDAVSLETNLHRILNEKRVNKINLRKEFFYSTIDELENLALSCDPTCEFNRTMLAEQYRQSLSITNIPDAESVNSYSDSES